MTSYVFISLGLVFVVPLAVLLTPSFKGLFVHACLTCFFHAMGALSLSLGLTLRSRQAIFWDWTFFGVSLALYLGTVLFLFMTVEHYQGTSSCGMEEIRRQHPDERVLLETKRVVWPLVLFPASRGVPAQSFTGRRWVSGIKASFGLSKLYLTDKRLLAQLVFPNVLIIDIERSDLGRVGFVDRERDLLGVRYVKSRVSPITKLLVFSGSPASRDTVFLNLGHESQRWLNALTASATP